MGRRRGGGGPLEDQYGEAMQSQDRQDHFRPPGGRGSGGGGSAGGSARPGGDLQFVRHVPKFLQAHAHLLGRGAAANSEDPVRLLLLRALRPPAPLPRRPARPHAKPRPTPPAVQVVVNPEGAAEEWEREREEEEQDALRAAVAQASTW